MYLAHLDVLLCTEDGPGRGVRAFSPKAPFKLVKHYELPPEKVLVAIFHFKTQVTTNIYFF